MLNEDLLALLKQIPDEAERAESEKLLDKYEFLRSGYLRQNDYDRKMNQWKDEQKRLEQERQQAMDAARQWQEWEKTNRPIHEDLLKQYDEVTRERDDFKTKVEQAALNATAGTGDHVDANALQAAVDAAIRRVGAPSKADIDKIIAAETAKAVASSMQSTIEQERKKFWDEALPAATKLNMTMTKLQLQHWKEFQEDLPEDKLAEVMKQEQLNDPLKAYDRFVEPRRRDVEKAKMRTEIEAEVRKSMSNSNVPGSGAPPAPELGPLQMFRQKSFDAAVPVDAEAGSGTLATAAAAELRAEGKW